MAKDHGKQIENDEKYEAIRRGREQGAAARIANFEGRSSMSKKELISALRNH